MKLTHRISRLAIRVSAVFAALLLVSAPAFANDKINIVASFSILGDMVKQVVGDQAEVTSIVGPDADAHVYQPSIKDARAVADADVIFVNGLGFETWSDSLIKESGTKARVFIATDGITPIAMGHEIDPHAWNSLKNGVSYIRNIAEALSIVKPEHEVEFIKNADAYIAKLDALDADVKARLAAFSDELRTVVTAHDAFGYLADAYGLNFLAPVGIDTNAEPSAKDLAALIDQLKADNAAALFVENITSPALMQQISEETGIELGGRLFSDALSELGGPATSYEAMFQHNLNTIINALGRYNN